MNIRYTRRAFVDRETIFDFLDARSPQGAINVQRAIIGAIKTLQKYPKLGRATEINDVRELIVPRYPYKVYYRIEDEEVLILHIRDARRRPWSAS